MRIVLAAINAKYIHSNLAVYSLRAYAKDYKEDISIAEYTINQQPDQVIRDLYKRKPDILCFSCYIWNISYVEELIRDIKKLLPKTRIWVGGPEVSYDAMNCLRRMPEVCGVMMGEGEGTFQQLMQHYYTGEPQLVQIRGIAFRDEIGTIGQNRWRDPIDLSTIPFVYEDMKDFEHKIIYYESSRGCPFGCSYCLSSVDKHLRFRDLEMVKKELQFFIDAKVPQVKFVDRTFNCNHKHAIEIWSYILEHDEGITNFHFEIAADLLNQEELSLIGQMRPGLIQLEIGVQSTNEETIREIRRSMKFFEVARVVGQINQKGNVHQHLDLIAGLPYEGLESFKQSFNDVYKLHPEQLQLGFLKVLKGSHMEKQAKEYGLVHKSKAPYEVLATSWLSYGEVLELKMVEDMVEVYYNSSQFSHTLRHLEHAFSTPYELYFALGKYYETRSLSEVSHSRIARYEILLDFIKELQTGEEELYKELLTFDLYLRENVKSRPAFAGDYTVEKEVKKQYGKTVHLERFSYDVIGTCERKELTVLFDYEKRSKLNHQAAILSV